MGRHAYGYKRSAPDPRDLVADSRDLPVLDEVDPRPNMPAIYDQAQLGSCTANAIAGALQYDLILDNNLLGAEPPSRLFIYYGEREIEGSIDEDSGAYGRDGFRFLRKVGAPGEFDWPYDITRFTERPPEIAYEEAARRKIGLYVHPGLPWDMAWEERRDRFKRLLSNNQTIAFGFTVYESFEGGQLADTGIMPMPSPEEQILGGHEVLLVGYLRDEPDYALCRNSWGPGWGMDGYFLMPWSFLCDFRQADDWRSIYRPRGS